ncbi:hypothetical protein DOTSEDRAFT_124112 [Dothistroma septosporum NZE10]|uniref:Uncharacterized protein n=1 Tax=Dothistroma septosporum (strain NZE10 / CBS 128990) TaxID=675120 RepID=N1PXN8_DOTSN|nr:hypothetical protein DOTSEDRAFT_124112 [Dothistroma septosporum NZE10]
MPSPSVAVNPSDLRLDDTTTQGSLWDDNATSIWHGNPSRKISAAWDALHVKRPVLISEEDMINMGQQLDDAVEWRAQGSKRYVANVNAIHLLHSLNTPRKAAFRDCHMEASIHLPNQRHLVDRIRQGLQCTASLHCSRLEVVRVTRSVDARFKINKKCRRWRDSVGWTEEQATSNNE